METLEMVDVSLAYQELADQGEGSLRLSSSAQAQLASSYQNGLKAKEQALSASLTEKRALMRIENQGQRDVELLVSSSMGLVWGKLYDNAVSRLGFAWAKDSVDDLKAEANLFLLERAASYDPEVCPSFNAWVLTSLQAFISITLRESGRMGKLPQTWERGLRMVSKVLSDNPTIGRGEIHDALHSHMKAWAFDKLEDEDKLLQGDALEEALRRKLSKQGMIGLLKNVDALVLMAQGEVRLDAPLSAQSATTIGEVIASAEDPQELGMLDELYQIALGEKATELTPYLHAYNGLLGDVEGEALLESDDDVSKAWSLTRLSQEMNISRVEVREVLKDQAQARLSAPHAQYAYFAPDGEIEFEQEADSIIASVRELPRETFAF